MAAGVPEPDPATVAYRREQARAEALLVDVHELLVRHAEGQARDPANHAQVGDLQRANELLGDVVRFLGGWAEKPR